MQPRPNRHDRAVQRLGDLGVAQIGVEPEHDDGTPFGLQPVDGGEGAVDSPCFDPDIGIVAGTDDRQHPPFVGAAFPRTQASPDDQGPEERPWLLDGVPLSVQLGEGILGQLLSLGS